MIESTYFHIFSVERLQPIENEWGTTETSYQPVTSLQDIECGFSQASRNNINTTRTESTNIISYNPKIFCNSEFEIVAGDRITVKFGTRNIGVFTASEPYIYETHQEIPLLKVGEA